MANLSDLPAELLNWIYEQAFLAHEMQRAEKAIDINPYGFRDSITVHTDRAQPVGLRRRATTHVSVLGNIVQTSLAGVWDDSMLPRGQVDHDLCPVELLHPITTAIVERLKRQKAGRIVGASNSLIRGVEMLGGLQEISQSSLLMVNNIILNDQTDIRCLLPLAATCRRLRRYAVPYIYKVVELWPRGIRLGDSNQLGFMLEDPYLFNHVRCLSFNSSEECSHALYMQGEVTGIRPIALWKMDSMAATIAACTALGPEPQRQAVLQHLGDLTAVVKSQLVQAWVVRTTFLFLCNAVRSLRVSLEGRQKVRDEIEGLLVALAWGPWTNVWTAGRIPALRELQEFAINVPITAADFDTRRLLPFLLLPELKVFCSAGLHDQTWRSGNPVDYAEEIAAITEHKGQSRVTEMIFDLTTVGPGRLQALLQLSTALEKLTYTYHDGEGYDCFAPANIGEAMLCQHRSLKTLVIRGCHHKAPFGAIPRDFLVLEELTIPFMTLLQVSGALDTDDPEEKYAMLSRALPRSIVRLELLMYDHIAMREWDPLMASILQDKEARWKKLTSLTVEWWMSICADCFVEEPSFVGDIKAGSQLPQLGERVGVEVILVFDRLLTSLNKCPSSLASIDYHPPLDAEEEEEDLLDHATAIGRWIPLVSEHHL